MPRPSLFKSRTYAAAFAGEVLNLASGVQDRYASTYCVSLIEYIPLLFRLLLLPKFGIISAKFSIRWKGIKCMTYRAVRIKDLPENERPRERLHKHGPEVLKDSELLAIILKSGFKGTTAIQLGEQILMALDGDLKRMADYKPKQFEKIKGVGEAKAAQIVAALELGKRLARFHAERDKITSPTDVADLMMSKMRYLQKEIVCVLCLDTKGGVTTKGVAGDLDDDFTWGKKLSEGTVFEGTLNASVFHPREIFRFAIEESANSIVLVHNHPSGDPQPSQEDIRATKQLIEAGDKIGIKVLDHIIIGDGIFVSLKEEGFI